MNLSSSTGLSMSRSTTLSEPADVLSGVPQGTVLGPLLFLLYINDLPQYVSPGTAVRLFADDSGLYRPIACKNDHITLQEDLNNLQVWEQEWSMQFHPQKCQLLRVTSKTNPSIYTYKIHGIDIEVTDDARYLGVSINNKLSWNNHIDNISHKANNTLNFIHRNFKTCKPKVKEKLYTTYVRPSLEFSSSVWDPHTKKNIDKLERVQRRAARFVRSNYSRNQSVTSLMRDMNWTPLRERKARAKVTTVYKATHHMVDIPFDLPLTHSNTRSSQNFYLPYARTDVYKHSYYQNAIRQWISLPTPIRESPSLSDFERAIKGHVIIIHY